MRRRRLRLVGDVAALAPSRPSLTVKRDSLSSGAAHDRKHCRDITGLSLLYLRYLKSRPKLERLCGSGCARSSAHVSCDTGRLIASSVRTCKVLALTTDTPATSASRVCVPMTQRDNARAHVRRGPRLSRKRGACFSAASIPGLFTRSSELITPPMW